MYWKIFLDLLVNLQKGMLVYFEIIKFLRFLHIYALCPENRLPKIVSKCQLCLYVDFCVSFKITFNTAQELLSKLKDVTKFI